MSRRCIRPLGELLAVPRGATEKLRQKKKVVEPQYEGKQKTGERVQIRRKEQRQENN